MAECSITVRLRRGERKKKTGFKCTVDNLSYNVIEMTCIPLCHVSGEKHFCGSFHLGNFTQTKIPP